MPLSPMSLLDRAARFARSRRALPACIALCLLLPLGYSSPQSAFTLGLPRVYSGDEPHFLVILHSLLDDGDVDLANDYRAVHDGSHDAGELFAGTPLDHHTNWVERGRVVYWGDVYETHPSKWRRSPYDGTLQPTLRDGRHPRAPRHEYPHHPIGLPLLLLPLLTLFKTSTLLEPAALLCSALATIAAMFLFRRLLTRFTDDPARVNLVTLAAFLGTPVWHYARTLFVEPWLLLFALAAYTLTFEQRRPLVAGALVALGTLLKAPFLLLAIPIALSHLHRRQFRALLLFSAPLALACALVLLANYSLFGSPFRTAYPWQQGNPAKGLAGFLFSPLHGLLPLAPALLLTLPGLRSLYRSHRRETLLLASASLLYALLFANWREWHGGYCYGPRYLVPLLPFLCIGLTRLDMTPRSTRIAAAFLLALSIFINARAALPYWSSWSAHPLALLVGR